MLLIRFNRKKCASLCWVFLCFSNLWRSKKKLNKKNSDAIFFLYLFSTCFISFTNHIWTEAINYETHPSLNKLALMLTHSHTYTAIQRRAHTHIIVIQPGETRLIRFWFRGMEFIWFCQSLSRSRALSLSVSSMLRALSRDHGFDFFLLSKEIEDYL